MSHGWKPDIALILAAHGDRAGEARNRLLQRHRDALIAEHGFPFVEAGVLKGEPELETALAAAERSGAARILVYPVFMADGYFVRKVLAERVARSTHAPYDILPPLGIDAGIAQLILAEALTAARGAGYAAAASRLLLVGHGSELGPASANSTNAAAAQVRQAGGFAEVDVAFLEEPPFLETALAASALPTVVSGFFSGDGLHAGEDVPGHIDQSRAHAVYAGSIGASAAIPALIAAAIATAVKAP
jgi:sirohydrochlorin ferrochelatase